MIYIISGTSRSGKTIIAQKMMKQTGIPYLSLDWLVMGFTNGIPEYGLHDKLWPHEIAQKFWSFFSAMLDNMIWAEKDYIIEGEAVLPELITEVLTKHPNKVKVCFVGYSEVDLNQKLKDVYEFSKGNNDWLTNESEAYVKDHISNMITYSKRIKASCESYDIPYFDTSKNFLQTMDIAIKYLLKDD